MMSINSALSKLLFKTSGDRLLLINAINVRYARRRTPFAQPGRTFEERNRVFLNAHRDKKLALSEPSEGKPEQWKLKPPPIEPTIIKKERKLPSLADASPPYNKYSEEEIERIENHGTWYDPLFNPHLHEERNRVNPDEEPFKAIYADHSETTEQANEYTKVRNITTPELWNYVEQLAKIKIAPMPERRKANEPIRTLPSGFVPPPETPPDLPYFIPRTRNHLLPVYYKLHSDPEQCYTIVKQVSGDLWKLEEDLRIHLESLLDSTRRILTSVQETDDRVLFRGKHINEVVAWLHAKGF